MTDPFINGREYTQLRLSVGFDGDASKVVIRSLSLSVFIEGVEAYMGRHKSSYVMLTSYVMSACCHDDNDATL